MYMVSTQSRVRSTVTETAAITFKTKGRPFSFSANSDDLNNGWTPMRLAAQGVDTFGRLSHVVLYVTTDNFQHILMLIEAWHEAGIAVQIKFPKLIRRPMVGTKEDPTFAGIDTEGCYVSRRRGGFSASKELKDSIRSTFAGDSRITVEE